MTKFNYKVVLQFRGLFSLCIMKCSNGTDRCGNKIFSPI